MTQTIVNVVQSYVTEGNRRRLVHEKRHSLGNFAATQRLDADLEKGQNVTITAYNFVTLFLAAPYPVEITFTDDEDVEHTFTTTLVGNIEWPTKVVISISLPENDTTDLNWALSAVFA
ncbi:hypothetical protein KDA23_03270 [Candidatus Saccharibacteria bacterium]|nr:hypothetical protein [Candidatus Saccharibacteria bacterium]